MQAITYGKGAETARVTQRAHSRWKKIKRRKLFLMQVSKEIPVEIFTPSEAAQLLAADLRSVKPVVRAAKRRYQVAQYQSHCAGTDQGLGPTTPPSRPFHILSRLNSSTVYPPIIPKQIDTDTLGLDQIFGRALKASVAGVPDYRVLDLVATATSIDWDRCAELLYSRKIIARRMDPVDIEITSRARGFWRNYEIGRLYYKALVRVGDIPLWEGDWAYCDRKLFAIILPNAVLTDHFEREEFLLNFVEVEDYSCVDVYAAPTALPLFQHRFLPRFNPLRFGKPRAQL